MWHRGSRPEVRKRVPWAGLALAGCAMSGAPADPIPASRPGLTDDAVVVAPASLQAELGAEVGRLGEEDFLGGELLLRYGVARAIEVRLGVESHGSRADGTAGHALADPEVGVKIAITEGAEGLASPAVVLIPSITLPVGADRLSSGRAEPGVLVAAGWDGPGPEWTVNLGGSATGSDAGRSLEVFMGVAAAHALSRRVDIEIELVRTLERAGGALETGLRHAAVGAAWLVHPDVQLDAWTGVRRDGTERGSFFGAGLSVRH
jgi:hypothetical protein